MKSNWPVYLYLNEHYNDKNYDQELPVKGGLYALKIRLKGGMLA
jgi:hypothetical protein